MSCKQCDMSEIAKNLPSAMASQSVDANELKDAIAEIMHHLDANACTRTVEPVVGTVTTGASTEVVCSIWVGGCYTETTGQDTSTDYSVGDKITEINCESIAITAYNYVQSKKTLVNMLQCNCNSTNVDIALYQKMAVNIDGLSCKDLSMRQEISAGVNIINELTTQQQADIKSVIETFLETTTDTLIHSIENSSAGSNVDVQAVSSTVTTESVANAVNAGISEILANVVSNQTMELNIKNTTITGSCTFDQNMLLEIAAGSALSSSLATLLSDTALGGAVTQITHTVTEEQDKGSLDPVDIITAAGSSSSMSSQSILGILFGLSLFSIIVGIVMMKKGWVFLGVLVFLLGLGMLAFAGYATYLSVTNPT